MDIYDRRVQKRESGGFIVSVPYQIVYALGIDKGTTVRFWLVNGKVIFKPIALDCPTEEDVADIDASKVSGENPGPDPSLGQTRPHTCCPCPDCGERRPGVQEPCRTPEAKSDVPWWASF